MQIVSGGVTNVGRVRTNNEDSFRIVESMSNAEVIARESDLLAHLGV